MQRSCVLSWASQQAEDPGLSLQNPLFSPWPCPQLTEEGLKAQEPKDSKLQTHWYFAPGGSHSQSPPPASTPRCFSKWRTSKEKRHVIHLKVFNFSYVMSSIKVHSVPQ